MPYPCSHFYFDINFGNRSSKWYLGFWSSKLIFEVTKIDLHFRSSNLESWSILHLQNWSSICCTFYNFFIVIFTIFSLYFLQFFRCIFYNFFIVFFTIFSLYFLQFFRCIFKVHWNIVIWIFIQCKKELENNAEFTISYCTFSYISLHFQCKKNVYICSEVHNNHIIEFFLNCCKDPILLTPSWWMECHIDLL